MFMYSKGEHRSGLRGFWTQSKVIKSRFKSQIVKLIFELWIIIYIEQLNHKSWNKIEQLNYKSWNKSNETAK